MKDFIEEMKSDYNNRPIPKIKWSSKLYDRISSFSNGIFALDHEARRIAKLCKKYNLKNKIILDIGSSFGHYCYRFSLNKNKVIGIELSERIEYAKKSFTSERIEFIQGDIVDEIRKLNDNCIDFVFCKTSPEHYDTGDLATSTYMKTLLTTLIPKLISNGIFYYLYPFKSNYNVSEESIRLFLESLEISKYEIASLENEDLFEFFIIKENMLN